MTKETESALLVLTRDMHGMLGEVKKETGVISTRLDNIDGRVCDLEDAKEATAVERVKALEHRSEVWQKRVWSVLAPVAVLLIIGIAGLVLKYLGAP